MMSVGGKGGGEDLRILRDEMQEISQKLSATEYGTNNIPAARRKAPASNSTENPANEAVLLLIASQGALVES